MREFALFESRGEAGRARRPGASLISRVTGIASEVRKPGIVTTRGEFDR